LVFAWPQAQIGVMGAEQAVNFVHRREIAEAEDPVRARASLADAYAREHLTAAAATAGGFVDEVIAPSTTRDRVASALATLDMAVRPERPAGNLPL
ncbi:MAG TPA: carboxyl transferase domain-containing protein, partial [Solirubrobacteraceae bacterium]|nr:carboxyl transferase domain-containing protein [Solirubrobacteraceae bacterium]